MSVYRTIAPLVLQIVTDENSLSEIAQYDLSVFFAFKGTGFSISIAITQAGVVSCGGMKSLSVHHP